MNLPKAVTTIAIVLSLVATQLVLPSTAKAGATLSFSPSSKTLKVGETWNVKVMVNADQQINSGTIKVTYNSSRLNATAINCGSDFSTPIAPSIANGSATISCARFSPLTGTGHIATVTFKASSAGSSSLGFGVSNIVANDGQGTNVYTGGGTASVTVSAPTTSTPPPSSGSNTKPTPTPPPANTPSAPPPSGVATPTISSTTHPDQNKWYKTTNIELSWNAVGAEYNYLIDQSANTQLPQTVKGKQTSFSQTIDGDGIWYAHVRAKSDKGWSHTAHYRIQLDTTPPSAPKISITPDSPMTVLPTIKFSATDDESGIKDYHIKLDDGEWQKVSSPYKPKQIASGEHTITVRATDKSGHASQSQSTFSIMPLAVPTIDSLPGGILKLGESFTIAGTAPQDTKVEIYSNGELQETVEVGKDGRYSSQEPYLLFPGVYDITVKAINADGITSPLSKPVSITIDAQAVSILGMVLPGWSVFGFGGIVLVGLLIGLLWLAYRMWLQTKSWSTRLGWVGQSLDQDLDELEQKVYASIESSVGATDPHIAEQVKAQIAEHFQKADSEVDDTLSKVGTITAESSSAPEAATQASAIATIVASIKANLTSFVAGIKTRFKPAKKAKAATSGPLAGQSKEDDAKNQDPQNMHSDTQSPEGDSDLKNSDNGSRQDNNRQPKQEAEKDSGSEPGPGSAEELLANLEAKADGSFSVSQDSRAKSDDAPSLQSSDIPVADILAQPSQEPSSEPQSQPSPQPDPEPESKPAPQPVKVSNAPANAFSALEEVEKKSGERK